MKFNIKLFQIVFFACIFINISIGHTVTLYLVSTSSEGTIGNGSCEYPSISANGRFVAFASDASNLVANDTNGSEDIFIHDMQTRETKRASINSSGQQANDDSPEESSISADGRYVTFMSAASNLVVNDTHGYDIFLHDMQTGQTKIVIVPPNTVEEYEVDDPFISGDGRYITFSSTATNIVANDTNGCRDIFVYDTQTDQSVRVSVDSNGVQANNGSDESAISADGRFVAFASDASNLVANDTNRSTDIFVHDMQTGKTMMVSVDSSGIQANSSSGEELSVSADGRFVAFASDASNLVVNDTNGSKDIFVHDMQTGKTMMVSVDSSGIQANSSSGEPSISADGRLVAFASDASNLVVNDTNGSTDIFVHDMQTGKTMMVSVDSSGQQANSSNVEPSISADGRFVAFASDAKLDSKDTNGKRDIYIADLKNEISTQINCDANMDGRIDMKDVIYLMQIVSGTRCQNAN